MHYDPRLETLIQHSGTPSGIIQALSKPSGSKFYKCAFQVNPYQYGERHAKGTLYNSESEYNAAMVVECIKNNIKIVSITDHFRYDTSQNLSEALKMSGIIVFPAFEANSSEGIHLLCLFPPSTSQSEMNAHIGACDLQNPSDPSPISNKRLVELLELVHNKGGIAICAHVTQNSGLLKTLNGSGSARMQAWKSQFHFASAIPGAVNDLPSEYKTICQNKNPEYFRERPVALLNASDVSCPEEFSKPSSSCSIKMSDVSIEGLKQAFLDPEGRVSLASDEDQKDVSRLISISWDRGLLAGQSMALNAGLNVLIGGRGAGKSTVVESIRYAFDISPKGKEALNTHKAMMKELLGSLASVAVLVYKPLPSPSYYLVERIYGQEPRVKDQNGDIIPDLKPNDLLPDLEVYGQHELSELTRDRAKLAEILKRFVGTENSNSVEIDQIQANFIETRDKILSISKTINQLDTSLAALPALKEKLRRFEATKVKDRAAEKKLIQGEARLIEDFERRINDLEAQSKLLNPKSEEVVNVLPSEDQQSLPNRALLSEMQNIEKDIDSTLRSVSGQLIAAQQKALTGLATIKDRWAPIEIEANKRFEKVKAELANDGFDPEEYVTLDDQIARLEPMQKTKEQQQENLISIMVQRKSTLDLWEKATAQKFTALEKAAKRVTRKLAGSVKVIVKPSSDLSTLEALIRKHVDGNISQAMSKLAEQSTLSLSKFADTIRKGSGALITEYGFTETSAKKFADADQTLSLQIEEFSISPEAHIELNIGRDSAENWKPLEKLSTGQKATAVLLLLLLETDAPLVIDQPEDDLDNKFIAKKVVPEIRKSKKSRQYIFSSHNPNIPVLGDADQIVGLTPIVEDRTDRTLIYDHECGSIDKSDVQELIKDLLEGGKEAFAERRQKYGF